MKDILNYYRFNEINELCTIPNFQNSDIFPILFKFNFDTHLKKIVIIE